MKAKHVKKLNFSKLLRKRNLFTVGVCTFFILCLSGIGIATANNLDEASAPISNEEKIADTQNLKPEPFKNDFIDLQESNLPKGYSDPSYYLGFTAIGKSSQVAIRKQEDFGGLPERFFYYSDDNFNTWKEYKVDDYIDIPSNATVYFKGINPEGINVILSDYYYFSFEQETSISVTGNVLSLLGEESDIQGVIPPSSTYCFYMLFYNCNEIKNVSQNLLKSSTLTYACYYNIFRNCSGIESIPEGFLPVEELASWCYASMFDGCTGLKSIPENLLPSKSLANDCYLRMFEGCKNLEIAPYLPAETLGPSSYSHMFNNCEKLNYVSVGLTQWDWHDSQIWLDDVSANGEFHCKNCLKQPDSRSADTVPAGWQIIPENYMTCSTSDDSATLSYSLNFSNAKDCNLYYSKDLISWNRIDTSTAVTKKEISSIVSGENLYMYGGNAEGLNSKTFIFNLLCEENLRIDGSVMALLGADDDNIPNQYCFNSLFKGCTGLTHGPSMPATNLKDYCYVNMFNGCSSLNKAPYLPATELKDSCYMEMFSGCTSMANLKVEFADWFEDSRYYSFDNIPTKNWLQGTNPELDAAKNFYCPPDLDITSNPDESHVPTWWTVKKDDVIEAEITGVNTNYDAQLHSIQVNVTTIGEFVPQYKYGDDNWKTTNYEFSEVGTYTVYVKIEKENYQTFEGSADVVINKNTEGQLSIVDCTKTYGDDDPNFAVQSSGFVGGYIPTEGRDFVVFRDKGEDVKPAGEWYTIHAYWINNNSNFEIAPAEGKMTITKANATLVAEEKSKLDNAEDPTFTAHMNGLVHGGDVLDASHYTITKQQNADGSISLSPALTAEGQQAFLGNYNVSYESALLKTYTNDEKVIVVPEYINVPGESSEAGIAQTQINNSNEENKEKTAFGKTNSDNDNESANGTNLALTLSLIANGLLIAFGIILFLKFKTRIFK